MAVTLTDVARAAEVSVATASRVLSRSDHPVHTATRARVLQAAKTLNYRPNLMARGLRTDRSLLVGVILENVAEHFSSAILRGVLDSLNETVYSGMIINTDYDSEVEAEAVHTLVDHSVEGMIFVDTALHSVDEVVPRADVPGIYVNRRYRTSQKHCVIPDNCGNARQATEHLLRLGHRRIAYIGGPEDWEATQERFAGYCDALQAYGLAADEALIAEGDWHLPSGYQAAQGFMRLTAAPTAIFASSDRMALGAIYAIQDAGLRVPQDVAIVGYDDRAFSNLVRPKITTVSLPGNQMGQVAVRLLLDQMGGRIEQSGLVPVAGELIVRESCGAGVRGGETES